MIKQVLIAAILFIAPAAAHAQSTEHLRCDGAFSYSQAQSVTTNGAVYGTYGYATPLAVLKTPTCGHFKNTHPKQQTTVR